MRRFSVYLTSKRVVAGCPLLAAAQDSGEVRSGLNLDQILDMVAAIAGTERDADYLEPMLAAGLDGLRPSLR